MKPMIWHPEANDQKVNAYLDHMNHAPYGAIIAILLVMFCFFTFSFLLIFF